MGLEFGVECPDAIMSEPDDLCEEEEIEDGAAEDPFIEEEEEDGDDVTDIIGGVDEEE